MEETLWGSLFVKSIDNPHGQSRDVRFEVKYKPTGEESVSFEVSLPTPGSKSYVANLTWEEWKAVVAWVEWKHHSAIADG